MKTYSMEKETMVELDPDDFSGQMRGLQKMAGRYHDMRSHIAMLIADGAVLPASLVKMFRSQQAAIDDERGFDDEQRQTRLEKMVKSAREVA